MSEVRDRNGDELHSAAGAYVLHALPEDERRAFEDHLASCAVCAREIADLSDSAARLAQPVTAEPPEHLRRRVLERIAVTPQAPYAPRVPREQPEEEVPQARAAAGEPAPFGTGRSPVPRILQLALAACAALAVAFGGVAAWQYQAAEQARSQLHWAEERYAGVADVLAAPDVELHTQQLADGGTGTVAVSRSQDAAVFFATGVPPLPVGQTYALWFSEDGSYRPAGLVSGAEAQDMQMLNGPVSGATAVGITIEPVGGSLQPTSPPLGMIDIPV
ncbi:anti-sigma factor [Streptomyces sp. WMMC940]|uniref:anti-sigma factor n=1 Tax=Streptomyces sp. WMMC940 TaxID=3015153 RepID=UPI0022B66E07|nr:anti-sigma factor [Streptomyces sp. WMMC940]MCZ7457260.1 anti-sigma factor [Streptomyces sp. WMMC940]